MLYNHVRAGQLQRIVPPGRKQGFYIKSEVDNLARSLYGFFEKPIEDADKAGSNMEQIDVYGKVLFSQATPDDMDGVYEIAKELFGHTTPAALRKPLIERCPEGNYVVKDNGVIVAFIHIQPLQHDRLMDFMSGKIRGWDLSPDDLEPFATGKTVECLIKSIGATKRNGRNAQLNYLRRLLRGTARELAKLGRKGIIITNFYATSETPTGIAMGFSANMSLFGNPIGKRLTFSLDVNNSNLPLLVPYKEALALWQRETGSQEPY